MALNKFEIVQFYLRRAWHHNFTAQLYYPIGFRAWAYRAEHYRQVPGLRMVP